MRPGMKNIFIFFVISILVLSATGAAQENTTTANKNASKKIQDGQPTTIQFDTGGKIGHFVYVERYYVYVNDGSANLTLDSSRKFFDGNINRSKIKFNILRPLDRTGKPYQYIKAVAMLDNETILNSWYKSGPANSTGNDSNSNSDPPGGTKKSPGFDAGISVIALLCLAILVRSKYRRK